MADEPKREHGREPAPQGWLEGVSRVIVGLMWALLLAMLVLVVVLAARFY